MTENSDGGKIYFVDADLKTGDGAVKVIDADGSKESIEDI